MIPSLTTLVSCVWVCMCGVCVGSCTHVHLCVRPGDNLEYCYSGAHCFGWTTGQSAPVPSHGRPSRSPGYSHVSLSLALTWLQRLWTQVLVFVHRALYLLSHFSNSRTLLLRNKMLGGPSHSRDMWLLNHFPAMLGLRQRLHISVKKFSTQSQGTKARTSRGFTWEYQVFLSIR